MKRKKKYVLTINEPWGIDCHYTFGGFEMIFKGSTPNGIEAKVTIRLHFCDMAEIANHLWRMIKQRREKIDIVEASLRGN